MATEILSNIAILSAKKTGTSKLFQRFSVRQTEKLWAKLTLQSFN